jgi:hypothetical protein
MVTINRFPSQEKGGCITYPLRCLSPFRLSGQIFTFPDNQASGTTPVEIDDRIIDKFDIVIIKGMCAGLVAVCGACSGGLYTDT